MNITSVEKLVQRANGRIKTLSPEQALEKSANNKIVLVDIRDIRELAREGEVDGAVHAPRGMLEFWFDPQCEYHREIFNQPDKTYVLFCALGWRSALGAQSLVDMGFENIAHVEGGFGALKDADALIHPHKSK